MKPFTKLSEFPKDQFKEPKIDLKPYDKIPPMKPGDMNLKRPNVILNYPNYPHIENMTQAPARRSMGWKGGPKR
jgi:hypothetical protein